MRKIAPKISIIFWSAWLLYSIILMCAYSEPSRTRPLLTQSYFQTFNIYAVKVAGLALSILLSKEPKRSWALMLALLGLLAFWRYYIGLVVMETLSGIGGLGLSSHLQEFWRNNTSSLLRFTTIPFGILLILSSIYWLSFGLAKDAADGK